MAALEFTGEDVVHVPVSYSWISTKRFQISDPGTDAEILQSLITHVQYGDPYCGGPVNERSAWSIHGPYELAHISVATFTPSDAAAARERLVTWATFCANDGQVAAPADLSRFLAEDVPSALSQTDATFYELPDIRATAEHEWGWVLGTDGFHEFVSIDRARSELTLIVASDD